MAKDYFAGLMNFWFFIAFILGIIAGCLIPSFILFFVFSLLTITGIWFFYKKNKFFVSDALILALLLFLGALWYIPNSRNNLRPVNSIVSLKVVSLPQEKDSSNTFFARIKQVPGRKIKVIDYTRSMEYLHSYKVEARFGKRRFQGKDFYCLWVKKRVLPQEIAMNFPDKWAFGLTDYFLSVFNKHLNDHSYRFLAAVFLGRRELLAGEREIFADAGVSHLLAISGLHMGLMAVILFFILRFFNVNFRPSLLVSIILLFLYVFLTGSSSSSLRAAIMYAVFALSFFARRKVNILNSLGLAGIVSLLINPLSLFEAGFQLSFLSVFGIITGFKLFAVRPCANRLINYCKHMLLASFWVSLFIMPVISYYFGRVYLLNVVHNLILIPFFTLILTVNFILVIFAPLDLIAQSIGEVLNVLIFCFNRLASFLGSIKLTSVNYSFSPGIMAVYYMVIAAIFVFLKGKNSQEPVTNR